MKIKLPDNWSEVSLNDYIEIVDIVNIDMDELDKQIKVVSILSKVNEDYLLKLSLTDIKKLIQHIAFIYTQPKGVKPPNTVTLKGVTYNVNYDLRTITGGEYIDLCEYTKEAKDVTRNLPNILAIFINPKAKECYEVVQGKKVQTNESRNNTAKLLLDGMNMQDVLAMSSFFLRSWEALTIATVSCLEKQNKKIEKELIKDLKSIGGGS